MPARFARLRIAGFKSFADPTTVEILPGLTGVVGPNGCGKSNVIEALRWAMGEANARNMRGTEMEDVIFAGTAGRSSRNLAEVTLTLEETLGIAPPPFHEAPDLEISRKIERGSGSSYRVKPVRVMCRPFLPISPPGRAPPPWSARAASARWSTPGRMSAVLCSKRPPASPGCTPAVMRPS
jgi:chromosome segregation protein